MGIRPNRNMAFLVAVGCGFGLPLAVLSVVAGLNGVVAAALLVTVAAATVAVTRIWGPLSRSQPLPPGRAVAGAALALVLVALLIQLVPYGRSRDNPPVTGEPPWDDPGTRALAVKACFDCHSNEVDYPWYADVAPMSWAVQRHVDSGRSAVNFSEWDRPQREAGESVETVEEGSMPPWYYRLTHRNVLSESEKQDLIAGLEATIGRRADGREGRDGDDD